MKRVIVTHESWAWAAAFFQWAQRQRRYVNIRTILVDGEGHIRGHNLVVADLAKLERAVGIHRLHLQDAVVLLSLDDGGFVGLLLEHWRILVDVVHLDVDSGPERDIQVRTLYQLDSRWFIYLCYFIMKMRPYMIILIHG